MIRKRRVSLLVPAVIGLMCLANSTISHAISSWNSASGGSCQPAAASEPITNGGEGAGNPSTSGASYINCPLNAGNVTTSAPTVTAALVEYADNHNSWNMACLVYERLPNTGSIYSTGWRYTCSVAGGCNDQTSNWTGINYIQWNTNELGPMATEYRDGNYGFTCYLPPKQFGAESAVISYFTAF